MVKPRSQTRTKKNTVTTEQAEKLAAELADKPYGSIIKDNPIKAKEKLENTHTTISLQLSLLEDIARYNKRNKNDLRSFSTITVAALNEWHKKHTS